MAPFKKQPVLDGELVNLRPLKREDFESLYSVASDAQIWDQHPSWNRYKLSVFKKLFRESLESCGCLVIIENQSGSIIGSSRYHGYNEAASEIEIGWTFIAREYWGGEYNQEIKRLMLNHAFQFVENVVFLVGPQNYRSRRAMEKIGGSLVGSRIDGSGNESLAYLISASDYNLAANKF
jgi:RimJ/RimL family protein N-acetyltransferase